MGDGILGHHEGTSLEKPRRLWLQRGADENRNRYRLFTRCWVRRLRVFTFTLSWWSKRHGSRQGSVNFSWKARWPVVQTSQAVWSPPQLLSPTILVGKQPQTLPCMNSVFQQNFIYKRRGGLNLVCEPKFADRCVRRLRLEVDVAGLGMVFVGNERVRVGQWWGSASGWGWGSRWLGQGCVPWLWSCLRRSASLQQFCVNFLFCEPRALLMFLADQRCPSPETVDALRARFLPHVFL